MTVVDIHTREEHQGVPATNLWRKATIRVSWKDGPMRWSASETVWYPADGDPRTAVLAARERMKGEYKVPTPGPGCRPEWSAVIDPKTYEMEES